MSDGNWARYNHSIYFFNNPIFHLDPELQLESVKFLLWVKPFSSRSSGIIMYCWPSICSSKVKLAGLGDSYLFMIQQSCLNLIFPVETFYFDHFSAPCLRDYRTVVSIGGNAHKNYFSGINYIYKHLLRNILPTVWSIKTNTKINIMF